MEERIKIPKEAIRKAEKKVSREMELENNRAALVATKVHKSKKTYSRKQKYKNYEDNN